MSDPDVASVIQRPLVVNDMTDDSSDGHQGGSNFSDGGAEDSAHSPSDSSAAARSRSSGVPTSAASSSRSNPRPPRSRSNVAARPARSSGLSNVLRADETSSRTTFAYNTHNEHELS